MDLIANMNIPKELVATTSREVELVWRVHLLNPQCYIKDCVRQFGRVVPHKCHEPNIEYLGHDQHEFREKVLLNRHPKRTGFIGSDLVMTDAIKRQCKFIHKMIKINLWSPIYLEHIDFAITRYEQFMTAIWAPDKPEGLVMVPTNDIDLIWHSHQLDPRGYHSFCITNSPTGQFVTHNDNIAGSVLKSHCHKTEMFWNSKFGATTYRRGRAFMEGQTESYESLVIHNNDRYPLYKMCPVIGFVLALIGVLIGILTDGQHLWIVIVATSVITCCSCLVYLGKLGGMIACV